MDAERFEVFEIWSTADGSRWELAAAFHDFDVASAVAYARGSRVRLVHAFYQDEALVASEVLVELGARRQEP